MSFSLFPKTWRLPRPSLLAPGLARLPNFTLPSGFTQWYRRLIIFSALFFGLNLTSFIFLPISTSAEPSKNNEAGNTNPQEIRRLTLDEIIHMGLEASPKLWAQRHVIEQAEAQFKQARAGRLPRMECYQIASLVPQARGDATWSPDERSDLFSHLSPFTRIEITATQPLYTFGRLKAHILAAEKGMEAKQASLERFEQELIKTLKELYYTLLLNKELIRLVSNTEEQFGKAVQKAEELLEENAGTLTQQDLLKLKYGHTRTRGQLLEIEKGERLVYAALHRLLFLSKEEPFELSEKRLKAVKIELKDLDTYQKMAKDKRPAWKQLEAGLAAKTAELSAEKKQFFPDIFLRGTGRYAVAPNRDKQENPFAVEDFNFFDGGVYLGWRLALDFGLPQRIAEKKAELFELKYKQKEATSGMLLEVEKAYEDVLEKQQGLIFARKARKNGRALSTLSAASFHLGLGEAKEVFEAFHIYTEAAAKYYLAIKDLNLAVAELTRVTAMEGLDENPQTGIKFR